MKAKPDNLNVNKKWK